jgi:AraC family transcriptional regulator
MGDQTTRLEQKARLDNRTNGLEIGSVRSPSFSVLRTKHAPGFRLEAHTHPQPCVVLPIAGTFLEISESGEQDCRPGSVIVEHPELPHENCFGPDGALNVVIHVHSATVSRSLEPLVKSDLAPAVSLGRALARLFEAPSYDELELEHLVLGVFSLCTPAPPVRTREPFWLREAIRLIWHAPFEIESISDLAVSLHVSPIRLARRFRDCCGVPLWRYIRNARTTAAHRLLRETTTSISTIAAELGYSDQAHLTRDLRRAIGMTPNGVRRLEDPDAPFYPHETRR